MAECYYFLWYQIEGDIFLNHGTYSFIEPKVLIQLKSRKIWSFMFGTFFEKFPKISQNFPKIFLTSKKLFLYPK